MAGRVRAIIAGCKGGDEMPLASYAAVMGIYNATFASLLWVAHSSAARPA